MLVSLYPDVVVLSLPLYFLILTGVAENWLDGGKLCHP